MFLTRVFARKVNSAGVALWSLNIACADGVAGHLSRSLPIFFHMTRAWPSQAGHLANGHANRNVVPFHNSDPPTLLHRETLGIAMGDMGL